MRANTVHTSIGSAGVVIINLANGAMEANCRIAKIFRAKVVVIAKNRVIITLSVQAVIRGTEVTVIHGARWCMGATPIHTGISCTRIAVITVKGVMKTLTT
jgi:hypothetical protein